MWIGKKTYTNNGDVPLRIRSKVGDTRNFLLQILVHITPEAVIPSPSYMIRF